MPGTRPSLGPPYQKRHHLRPARTSPMLIECPFCHTRAQVQESQEGAKVRCGDCGRIYGARPAGAARSSSNANPMPFVIGGALVVVAAILFSVINNHEGPPRKAPESKKIVRVNSSMGWDSEAVLAVRNLYDSARDGNRTRLINRIAGEAVLAAEQANAAVEGYEGLAPSSETPWATLKGFERTPLLEAWADSMMDTTDANAPVNWIPFEGGIEQQAGNKFVMHIQCTPSNGGTKAKVFEWVMLKEGETMRASAWGEYIDPESIKISYKSRMKGIEKKTLSDGSRVHERQPEPLAHLDDTPQELRDEIESLFVTIIDMNLTKEISRAKNRLVEIGKPVIPRLLTALFELPIDPANGTDEDERMVQNVVDVLRDITGQFFGFEPLLLEGSSMGTTLERQESSIKQWFAWWYKNGKRFEIAKKEDALEAALGELSAEDKRWLEMHPDK